MSKQTVHALDPLTDPRWPEFLGRQERASVFHSREWLLALQRTYGYRPVVYSTSHGARLSDGVVFCRVESWLTGNRLVSLPFSDHCQPLASRIELKAIVECLHRDRTSEGWKYIELRPVVDEALSGAQTVLSPSHAFRLHEIDLKTDLGSIASRFHESCIRRKLRRADREQLPYESVRS